MCRDAFILATKSRLLLPTAFSSSLPVHTKQIKRGIFSSGFAQNWNMPKRVSYSRCVLELQLNRFVFIHFCLQLASQPSYLTSSSLDLCKQADTRLSDTLSVHVVCETNAQVH